MVIKRRSPELDKHEQGESKYKLLTKSYILLTTLDNDTIPLQQTFFSYTSEMGPPRIVIRCFRERVK